MSAELDLLTIGRVNLDLYAQQVGAEFEDTSGFNAMVGGSPTNIAVAAARLGVATGVFTSVGEDPVGDWVLRALREDNVQTDFVVRKAFAHTSLALLAQIPPARFPRVFYRENPADIHLTDEDARGLPLELARVVLVSGDVFARGSAAGAARWIVDTARAYGTTLYFDLDLRLENWPSARDYAAAVEDVAEQADVVLGTTEEWGMLLRLAAGTDQKTLFRALGERLLGGPDKVVVVKRGERGAVILRSRQNAIHVPPFPVPVASTVGAGDAFAAGLISARLDGQGWVEAGRLASACGALTASRAGCSRGFPTCAEVATLLDRQPIHTRAVADAG
jgi:5-dehydro-2-deoxygluconokinase